MLHGNEGNYFVRKPQKHRRFQLFSSCLYAINTKKILKIAAFLFRFLLIFAEWLNSYLARIQIPISHILWARLKKICGFGRAMETNWLKLKLRNANPYWLKYWEQLHAFTTKISVKYSGSSSVLIYSFFQFLDLDSEHFYFLFHIVHIV